MNPHKPTGFTQKTPISMAYLCFGTVLNGMLLIINTRWFVSTLLPLAVVYILAWTDRTGQIMHT